MGRDRFNSSLVWVDNDHYRFVGKDQTGGGYMGERIRSVVVEIGLFEWSGKVEVEGGAR